MSVNRKLICMQPELWDMIDERARATGNSRSGWLAKMALDRFAKVSVDPSLQVGYIPPAPVINKVVQSAPKVYTNGRSETSDHRPAPGAGSAGGAPLP